MTNERKRLYNIYKGMKTRCYKQRNKSYKYYGEKNIKICEEWLNNFNSFYEWSINNGYQLGLSIDRIDCNEDYKPNNCRWVTKKYNSAYKSTTNMIEIDGVMKSGREWSKTLNRSVNYINKMIKRKGLLYTKEYIKKIMGT